MIYFSFVVVLTLILCFWDYRLSCGYMPTTKQLKKLGPLSIVIVACQYPTLYRSGFSQTSSENTEIESQDKRLFEYAKTGSIAKQSIDYAIIT